MIVVNGRLLREHTIGVSRYTNEVVNRFRNKARIIKPRGLAKKGKGIIWEQLILPRKISQKDLLWSPANTGPIYVKNQVITIHDVIPLDHPEWFNLRFASWYRFLLPRLSKRARKIITISQYSKERIIQLLNVPDEKVAIIPEGVGDNFKPIPEINAQKVLTKYGVRLPFLLVVGSIEPRKNLSRLFNAWENVHLQFPDLELVVIGVQARSARNSTMTSIPDSVHLLGYVQDAELPSIYSAALALVFPSLYEGFGLPILEAMACGTPVIASNSTSIPEVVGEAGLLFNPFDIDAITATIEKFVQDSELQEILREKGFKQASKFSWDTTAQQVWSVLSETLSEIQS